MKQQHKKILILLCLALLTGGFFLYRPMKENHIYQRELKLVNDQSEAVSTFDEEKLIERAKASLKDYTSYPLLEDQYEASVSVEPYGNNLLNNVAIVNFSTKDTHALVYSIGYDTSTGVLVQFYATLTATDAAVMLDAQTLEKKAKEFFFQVNNVEEKDIQYEADYRNGFYVANILMKKDYQQFFMYLNSSTGDVMLYEAYHRR